MPTITHTRPSAVLPGGELELFGSDLSGLSAELSGVDALVTLARSQRATVRVPEGVLPGELIVHSSGQTAAPVQVQVGVPMAENLHPVSNPAVDADGNVYTTLSGSRGQATPVSVFKIGPAPEGMTHELRPFVRDILNATGLAFSPAGELFVSSRADGIVYRIDAVGDAHIFAEGLGIATGLAFDSLGDLYVGDRSGTIFKIRGRVDEGTPSETYVFATLEPSISAYHLAFDSKDTLYVTGPTTSSSQAIYAVDRGGVASVFYRGLGRAQGMAFDMEDNLYVAASLRGNRGIIRITPALEATLIVSAPNLVGLCFLPEGRAALATRDAVFEVKLGIAGRGF